jgi:hypothetical protein
MRRELAESLDALWKAFCSRSRPVILAPDMPRFIVWRQRRLLGMIPYRAFAGYVILWDFGDYWRAMLTNVRRTNGPFIGADFDRGDAARIDAWKWTLDSGQWIRLSDESEKIEAYERIEDSIKNAALSLPPDQA